MSSCSATQVTGFTVTSDGLFLRGCRKQTTPLRDALNDFLNFLRSFRRPVLLAAHNARRFDAPVFTRVLAQNSLLLEFQQVVCGFLDTFLLSKSLYPRLASYSQEYLVQTFLWESYNAHDAVEDARMLQELYRAWKPHPSKVLRSTFNDQYFIVSQKPVTTASQTHKSLSQILHRLTKCRKIRNITAVSSVKTTHIKPFMGSY
uniref:exodeoxyribonuclease III n=1 Tax=Oryzias latipes TaxID=8090 RepID=A0A3P9I3D8_ORYLA